MRVVVVGGGYAGLACLARLARVLPDAERHLVDPGRWHLRRTLLHETVRKPLAEVRADFGPIARRWGFRHHHARVDWSAERLVDWARRGALPLGARELAFDALVIATGLPGPRTRPTRSSLPMVQLESLGTGAGVTALRQIIAAEETAWVIGAGASGLQCLFELAAARPPGAPLGLVEAGETVLQSEPGALRRAVKSQLKKLAVDVHLETRFAGAGRGRIRLEGRGGERALPAGGILLCTGSNAPRIDADAAGRVLWEEHPLPGVFAAGDCARWRGVPFDAATAQSAVRKGRHVAESLAHVLAGRAPEKWDARQLGYFLSLGPDAAAGWLFSRAALVTGLPAMAAREAVETRWNFLLQGIDSFAAF